jgi:protein transport protein SEC61 subunit gamma-like protein
MSEKLKEFIDIPQQFVRDGNQVSVVQLTIENLGDFFFLHQFLTRCTKPSQKGAYRVSLAHNTDSEIVIPEFIQICRAVAVGFAVMGFIGYFVKLIHIPMCVLHIVPHISHAHIVLLETTFLCTCHFT